jgi:hypothetical protein
VLWQDEQVKFIPPEEVEGGTAEGAKGTAKGAKGAKEAEG